MAEFPPSPVDRPSRRRWLPPFVAVIGVIVGTAIVKPWGPATSPAQLVPAASRGAPGISAVERTASPAQRSSYDPRLFGNREPDPAWELWPAGYVVEFGIAGPVPVRTPELVPPPTADVTPTPNASGPPVEPLAPAVVDLGSTDHLVALGINTPLEVRVAEIALWILHGNRCCREPLRFVRLPTLWESRHFYVIGVEDPARPGQPGDWPTGEYRLHLVLRGGEIREVAFRVTEPIGQGAG